MQMQSTVSASVRAGYLCLTEIAAKDLRVPKVYRFCYLRCKSDLVHRMRRSDQLENLQWVAEDHLAASVETMIPALDGTFVQTC